MNFKSKKTPLIILGLTSLVCSRAMFALFNDPEGPNLLIVVVMAAILYVLSWAAYSFIPLTSGLKKLLLAIFVQIIIVAGLFFWNLSTSSGNNPQTDYRNAEYLIEGEKVKLGEEGTQYFGNELRVDLNGDGHEDRVFLITEQRGGSGTFYYAVAALSTRGGYIGSDGYLLGDRIAPQTTEISQNPRHQRVVVVNYADRAPGEPMTASPSHGKSIYLKLDPESVRWGIVEPNFEGESR
jgi:hypothetical protein